MRREPLFTARFAALWIFQFGTFFAAFQLLPVIPLRITELGGSRAAAGWFLGVYTFASAFAAPVTGTIADHFGRKRMLVLASLLFIVFSLAYGVVPWIPVLLIIGVVHGVLWSGILSSAGAIMTGIIPASRRTEGLAWWGIAPTAAIAIAPAAGMLLYRNFGWFVVCAEVAVLSGLAALWASKLTDALPVREQRSIPSVSELWDWPVLAAGLSLASVSFGYGGITSFAALLARERSIEPESLFFTVFAISVVVIRIFTSGIADRFGTKVLLYPALALMPVSFALLARADDARSLTIAAALFGTGLGASFPSFMNFVVTHTAESRRGRTIGSVILAFDAGIGLGSIVVGAVGQRFGLARAFDLAAVIGCLAIPVFMLTSRRVVRGTPVAESAADGQQ